MKNEYRISEFNNKFTIEIKTSIITGFIFTKNIEVWRKVAENGNASFRKYFKGVLYEIKPLKSFNTFEKALKQIKSFEKDVVIL